MHLFYKLDINNTLWFLYAGGVIFRGEKFSENDVPIEPKI
jgi:hypothetical protein